MTRTRTRVLIAAASAAAALTLTACGGDDGDAGETTADAIAVTSTDTECKVATTELTTGPHTFAVTNDGSQVTEFYILTDTEEIVGEVENIAPGITRTLTLPLKSGDYIANCKPGMTGEGIDQPITVTGDDAAATDDPELAAAVADYKEYVAEQADELVRLTGEFTAAVKDGDAEKAKELYPLAREPWERIEPVAEVFGDLDPIIDGREADVPEGGEFTGFHKLEKDLWETEDISESGPIADKLLDDVTTIAEKAKGVELSAAQVGNGAKALLDEVASTKMTGEEDQYSHTDLWDFNANIEGARQVLESLRPILENRDPEFLATLDEAFTTVEDTLAKHKDGDGWKLHTELTQDDLKELSDVINALAEPLSHLGAKVLPSQ